MGRKPLGVKLHNIHLSTGDVERIKALPGYGPQNVSKFVREAVHERVELFERVLASLGETKPKD